MSFQSNFRFLVDENIPIKTIGFLKKAGFDVKTVFRGMEDKDVSKLAKAESRIILTFDRHFINRYLFPQKEHYGTIFLNIHPPIIETIDNSLKKFLNKTNPQNIKGKLFILSSYGVRVRG